MITWWNSLDAVSLLATIARWAGAIFGLLILVLAQRVNTLQGRVRDAEKRKADTAIGEARELGMKLAERQAPRSVSPTQKANFIASVAAAPKGRVLIYSYLAAGPETNQFAYQLRELVVAAGFDSGPDVFMQAGGAAVPVGIAMGKRDANTPPPFAAQIQGALLDAGIQTTVLVDPLIPPDELRVSVGRKPE